jgi:TPR repeat protein
VANIRAASLTRLRSKSGIPTNAEISNRYLLWDYAQANDLEIWTADPNKDELRKAIALRKIDPENGFRQLLRLAESGSVWGMLETGVNYRDGAGATLDRQRAKEWEKLASENGCQTALLVYCTMLMTDGDLDGAIKALRIEAAKDWPPALYWLSVCRSRQSRSRKTMLEVRSLLERAAALGSPGAQRNLAIYMAKGRFGLREIPRGLRLLFRFARKMVSAIDAEEAERKMFAADDAP